MAVSPISPPDSPMSDSSESSKQNGQDDEALSSLLLLLRSNQTKDHSEGSGIVEASEDTRNKKDSGSRNSTVKQYSVEELRGYFHLPIVEVAKQLGICTTLLKKICRKSKIKRWPYRQIRSITKSVQSLEMASLNDSLLDSERARYREQITLLQNTLDLLIQDPNTPVASQIMLEGIQGIGDIGDLGDELSRHKPKTDVAAVLAAAAATASFEGSESISKKKKQQAAEELQKQQEDEHAAAESNTTPMVIGVTTSGHAIVTQNGKLKLKFHPPVQLAPLERRKMRSQKKLVPLIEPDICNYVHIDFLPRALLRLKVDKLDATLQDVQQHMSVELVSSASSNGDQGISVIPERTQVDMSRQFQVLSPAATSIPLEATQF